MLPPDPRLVREYFNRRRQLPLGASGPAYADRLTDNDRLWNAICERADAGLDVLTASEPTPLPLKSVNTPGDTTVDRRKEFSGAAARAAYMRDYMRRRRATKRT